MQIMRQLGLRIRQWLPANSSRRARHLDSSIYTTGAGFVVHSRTYDDHTPRDAAESFSMPDMPEVVLPPAVPLVSLKREVARLLLDCGNAACEKNLPRIEKAVSALDLWLMRIDIYQCVARAHGQGVARERINSLLPKFTGWLPPRLLMPV